MADKEVGELWRALLHDGYGDPDGDRYARAYQVADLIRKLVEERAIWHNEGKRSGRQRHIEYALRDFGIDPATWKDRS